jgi:hypothetical protein
MTKDEVLRLALTYVQSTHLGGAEEFELLGAIRGALSKPEDTETMPDSSGVLFAVERAVENGDCPFEIEQAFDDYEAGRIRNK